MSKGADTRQRILDRAFSLATRDGLGGLTIGALAEDLGLSKSGLFAHFGSKEDLQIEVMKAAAERFMDAVLRPAFKAARGAPRVRALVEHWLAWLGDPAQPGGCLFMAAATELDDRPGRPRDYLVGLQREFIAALSKAGRLAVEAGHLRADLDCDQFAFELFGVLASCHHYRRLLRDRRADSRARAALERLMDEAAAGARGAGRQDR
jgi:AcrR family transcriptional regulator